ncbi:hypothetical protein CHS0354_026758 [Potamilus streckersoni]|uniref:Protein kinase domain-containing protein n=1 Tax=Potamilus streckersoni TaxID=2493646 RepID=A0AAE0SAL1_9BIVA|nr:hypothetical protein CHS0354_026758 [Potamilus streckersoni]
MVSEILRREVQFLEKIKHSRILSVIHPLEECHNSIAFATEPIFASLANLLGNYDRMPVQIPQDIKENEFLEFEIRYGILQITEALSYLHSTEQLVHRNVCPESILLTKRRCWKLAGLGFAEKFQTGKETFSAQPWSTKAPKLTQPNLNFIAPEIQLDKKGGPSSDMYSLGFTICTLYNNGTPLINADHNTQLYVKQLEHLTQMFGDIAHKMPLPLVEPVEKMINRDTRYRPTAQLFSLLKYFHDPLISVLQFLDTMDPTDPAQRAEMSADLVQAIPTMPRKILYNTVLPALFELCRSSDTALAALPPLITLIDFSPRDEFIETVLPEFRQILSSPKPLQATVYLLDKLDIILSKSPTDDIKNVVLPLVFNTLDSNSIQAQEAALSAIRIIRDYLDNSFLQTMVLPKAKTLYYKSDNIKMRSNALVCIDHLLDSLDKMIILDEVVPFLTEISCQDSKIIMAVVGIYKHLLSDKKFGLTHNLIATKVMPPLIAHTVNPGLSMEQFSALMEVLREMLEQIDRQRRNKMKQEEVSVRVPPRGLINMQADGPTKDDRLSSRNLLSVDDAAHGIQKSRTESSFTSLRSGEQRSSSCSPKPSRGPVREASIISNGLSRSQNATPKVQPKNILHNASAGSLDETLNAPHSELPRRHSLVPPPVGGAPVISLTSDESPSLDRPRRPSAQSLGPFSFSDSERRGSRSSVLSGLGLGESHAPTQRRASFQALGESVMHLFSGK